MVLLALFSMRPIKAQNSAYMVSPRWMVGKTSGMNFVSGTNTIIDPVNLGGNPASNPNQEATSSICQPDKTMAFYCNNYQIYDGANALLTPFVNLASGGYSSTQGCLTIPDPATLGDYYLFSGNDITGGSSNGINWYKLTKSGATFTISTATNIATSGQVSEGLTSSSDGAGGYWVISHTQDNSNYYSWHVTAAGVGPRVSSATSSRGGFGAGGTIRINKCQDKIAMIGSQEVEVYAWNKTTGTTGALLNFSGTGSGPTSGYAGDFSPNGNVLYFSGLNSGLLQWDLTQSYAAGVVAVTGSAVAAGIQLGPNNKIYASTAGTGVVTTAVGVVANPNTVGAAACGYTNAGLTLTGTGVAIGLASISWLNPQNVLPLIDTIGIIGNCTDKTFSINFPNYFGDQISKQTATILWDWGHGGLTTSNNANPSHTFPSTGGPYTVTLTFKDIDGCQTWTKTKSIPILCPAPVELINFNAHLKEGGVLLTWQTAMELNNDFFELQRSVDGIHFETITKVTGAGNSTQLHSYEYNDVTARAKVVYYRLVQHDFDGKTETSSIVAVNLDKTYAAPIVVMPNPFSSSFILTKLRSEQATILVYDVLGRLLEQRSISEAESTVEMGASLANGSYLVKYLTLSDSYSIRIEKK